MSEKERLFNSKAKYQGIFNFSDFYQFCYTWLVDNEGYLVIEDKYTEKIQGDQKKIEVEWTGEKKITDYFKNQLKIKFRITDMVQIEITDSSGKKKKTNKGTVEVAVKGILVRDYDSKFETTATKKFMRGIYEKWVIASRVDEMQTELLKFCDEFLAEVKAYLDLEGKK